MNRHSDMENHRSRIESIQTVKKSRKFPKHQLIVIEEIRKREEKYGWSFNQLHPHDKWKLTKYDSECHFCQKKMLKDEKYYVAFFRDKKDESKKSFICGQCRDNIEEVVEIDQVSGEVLSRKF